MNDPAPGLAWARPETTPPQDEAALMDSHRTYTTSQLADAAGVGSQTLRYYERRNLLPEPPRTRGGHRIYGHEHLDRLLFIQRVQCLGFQLDEVHRLIELTEDPTGDDAAGTIAYFIDEIDRKAMALQQMRVSLGALRAGAEEKELSMAGAAAD